MTSLSRLLYFALIAISLVLVSARGGTVVQTPDAKSKGTGSISGKVTLGGKAAAGIPVAAFGNDPNGRRAAPKTTTDSEGHYRLFGLAAAAYQIVPLTPSFIPAERNPIAGYPYYGAAKTILLSPGESVEDVDLKLVRGNVITGHITDEEGRPVGEERINLQTVDQPRVQTSSFMMTNYQMYQTDDRGVYRLYGLPGGRYK